MRRARVRAAARYRVEHTRGLDTPLAIHAGDRERHRGRDGDGDGDGERHAVHFDRVRARQLSRRECNDHPHHAMGDGDAEDSPRGRHNQRVPERQQQQAPRRGAQRHPHGELLPLGEFQRKEQGADVDDRHQQHESARHQQQENEGTHVAQQVVVEGLGRGGHAAQQYGKDREVALKVVRELGRGLLDRRAGRETADQVHIKVRRAGLRDRAERTRRRPHLRPGGESEATRHHRDNRRRLPSNREHAAKHRGIRPIATLPQVVADRDHRRRGHSVIFFPDVAAQQGRDPEHAEQISGNQRHLQVHTLPSLADGKAGRAVIVDPGDGGERLRRGVYESLERAVRDRHVPRSGGRIDAPEHRQVPLLMHGQRPHEHGIGDAEGRGGGANADREGRDRDETEGRPRDGDPDVLQHAMEPRCDPNVAHVVAGERQVAERAPGGQARRSAIVSAGRQLLALHLQVEPQLVVELAFMAIALEQVPETAEQPDQFMVSYVASSTRWIATMIRSNSSRLRANCCRPVAVKV